MNLSKLIPITLLLITFTIDGNGSITKTSKDTKATSEAKGRRAKNKIQDENRQIHHNLGREANHPSMSNTFNLPELKRCFDLAEELNKGEFIKEGLEELFINMAEPQCQHKCDGKFVLNALIDNNYITAIKLALLSYPYTSFDYTYNSVAQYALEFAFEFLTKHSTPPQEIERIAELLSNNINLNELYDSQAGKRYLEKVLEGSCARCIFIDISDFIYYPSIDLTIPDIHNISEESLYIRSAFVDAILTGLKEVIRRGQNSKIGVSIFSVKCPSSLKANSETGYDGYFFPLAKAIKALDPNISIYSGGEIGWWSFEKDKGSASQRGLLSIFGFERSCSFLDQFFSRNSRQIQCREMELRGN